MNNIKKYSVTLSILVIGFLVGASALSVMAQGNNWNPPPQSPPFENVDAPINTGGTEQVKTGLLTLGNFQFTTGVSVPIGHVLTATDVTGQVGWRPIPPPPPPQTLSTRIVEFTRSSETNAVVSASCLATERVVGGGHAGCEPFRSYPAANSWNVKCSNNYENVIFGTITVYAVCARLQ